MFGFSEHTRVVKLRYPCGQNMFRPLSTMILGVFDESGILKHAGRTVTILMDTAYIGAFKILREWHLSTHYCCNKMISNTRTSLYPHII
jgi:hypothetical protein